MRRSLLAMVLILTAAAPAVLAEEPAAGVPKAAARPHALIKTTMGDIEVELWPDVAPRTVEVFLGLAEGEGTFSDIGDPAKKVTITKPFYDGLAFHRVIKGFMLQGGCPHGNGSGDAGFKFADEINAEKLGLDKERVIVGGQPHPWIRGLGQAYWVEGVLKPVIGHLKIDIAKVNTSPELQKQVMDKLKTMSLKDLYEIAGFKYDKTLPSVKPTRGTLALANAGPNTNGSQFFINLGDPVYLTGKHTVFGRVVKGMEVVDAIGNVKTSGPPSNRPLEPVKFVSIRRVK